MPRAPDVSAAGETTPAMLACVLSFVGIVLRPAGCTVGLVDASCLDGKVRKLAAALHRARLCCRRELVQPLPVLSLVHCSTATATASTTPTASNSMAPPSATPTSTASAGARVHPRLITGGPSTPIALDVRLAAVTLVSAPCSSLGVAPPRLVVAEGSAANPSTVSMTVAVTQARDAVTGVEVGVPTGADGWLAKVFADAASTISCRSWQPNSRLFFTLQRRPLASASSCPRQQRGRRSASTSLTA